MARRHNGRCVKIHRTYSISEAATLLSVAKHTVSRWIDAGLPLIERKRPFLIQGGDLRAFLAARQPVKKTCRPGEIYCVKCRTPKRPAFDDADFIPKTPTTGQLVGLCPTCGTLIYRLVKITALNAAAGDLKLSLKPAAERLNDTAAAALNVHIERT